MANLTHGSFFSGIGGFDVGAKRAGVPTLWTCEIEKYQQKILKQITPNAQHFYDITQNNRYGYVDIVSGGFPCQDISVAGKMEGLHGSRSGLWHQMYYAICVLRPKYIIIENSPALAIRGLDIILCQLAKIGYDAEWQVISNSAFGYPTLRKRIYIIAYTNQSRFQSNLSNNNTSTTIFRKWTSNKVDGYTLSKRVYEMPTSVVVRNGDGFQHWSHRVASLGNSVNPTLAHYLFDCILKHYHGK